MKNDELNLISTDDLANELASRFDSFVCAGIQKTDRISHTYFHKTIGSIAECMGLTFILTSLLQRGYHGQDNP